MNDYNPDEPEMYVIPPNFVTDGTFLGGLVKQRNAVEAIVILVIISFLVLNIFTGISLIYRGVIIIVLGIPPSALAIFGLNDGPLSVFLLDCIKFKKSKRKLSYFDFKKK